MGFTYLLDTNILSEPLKPQPKPWILQQLEEHAAICACPSLVLHELYFGALRLPAGPKRRKILSYLEEVVLPVFAILDYDLPAAHWHAEKRAQLVQQGLTPTFVDGQIAAIAKVHGLTLVSLNTRDFQVFGLPLTNWAP